MAGNSAVPVRKLPPCYTVRCHDTIFDLSAEYDVLFDSAAYSFFLTRSWFEILETTTKTAQDRFFYLTVEAGTEPLALMALRSPAGQLGSSLQGQNTGAGSLASLTNWYSCLYDILLSPDAADPDAVVQKLVDTLLQHLGRAAVVEFNYLDQNSGTADSLTRALRSTGLITVPYHHSVTRYEDLGNVDFDNYLKQRPADIRKETARCSRRLAEKYQVEQVVYCDDSQLQKALADYQKVHAASWKNPERFPHFIPELFRRGLGDRQLRVGILYLDGQPVATELYILFNGQATSYKGSYDTAFRKNSPASVLQLYMIKYLMEVDHVHEINLGYGDEPYKKKWLTRRRDLAGILAFNPRSVTALRLLARQIRRRMKIRTRFLNLVSRLKR